MNGYDIREVLGEMVSAGEDRQIIANLLHSLGYAEAHVRYLGGPIVTLEAQFTELVLTWLTKVIALNRLNLILNEASVGMVGVYATPIEVLTYLHPRPTANRMAWQAGQGETWSALYAYLSEEIRRQQDGDTLCWELKEQSKVANLARFDLSSFEAREYLRLASLVRHLVVTRAPYSISKPVGAYATYPQGVFENLFRQ